MVAPAAGEEPANRGCSDARIRLRARRRILRFVTQAAWTLADAAAALFFVLGNGQGRHRAGSGGNTVGTKRSSTHRTGLPLCQRVPFVCARNQLSGWIMVIAVVGVKRGSHMLTVRGRPRRRCSLVYIHVLVPTCVIAPTGLRA